MERLIGGRWRIIYTFFSEKNIKMKKAYGDGKKGAQYIRKKGRGKSFGFQGIFRRWSAAGVVGWRSVPPNLGAVRFRTEKYNFFGQNKIFSL